MSALELIVDLNGKAIDKINKTIGNLSSLLDLTRTDCNNLFGEVNNANNRVSEVVDELVGIKNQVQELYEAGYDLKPEEKKEIADTVVRFLSERYNLQPIEKPNVASGQVWTNPDNPEEDCVVVRSWDGEDVFYGLMTTYTLNKPVGGDQEWFDHHNLEAILHEKSQFVRDLRGV